MVYCARVIARGVTLRGRHFTQEQLVTAAVWKGEVNPYRHPRDSSKDDWWRLLMCRACGFHDHAQNVQTNVNGGLALAAGLDRSRWRRRFFHNTLPVGDRGVTKIEIYFWNGGTSPILQKDILEPFTVTLTERILNYSVVKCSRDVVGLHLSFAIPLSAYEPTFGNKLKLDFEILEPGDGATLEIVYDGPATAKVEFSGSCVGAGKPTVLPADTVYFTTRSRRLYDSAAAPDHEHDANAHAGSRDLGRRMDDQKIPESARWVSLQSSAAVRSSSS